MDILDTPHYFCTKGGYWSLITSNVRCPRPTKKKQDTIKPVFVVKEADGSLIEADKYFENNFGFKFEQISNQDNCWHRINFELPKQEDPRFLLPETPLYLTLKRSTDPSKPYADGKVRVKYLNHKDQDCVCHWAKPIPDKDSGNGMDSLENESDKGM